MLWVTVEGVALVTFLARPRLLVERAGFFEASWRCHVGTRLNGKRHQQRESKALKGSHGQEPNPTWW
jgi:hypothetical protein